MSWCLCFACYLDHLLTFLCLVLLLFLCSNIFRLSWFHYCLCSIILVHASVYCSHAGLNSLQVLYVTSLLCSFVPVVTPFSLNLVYLYWFSCPLVVSCFTMKVLPSCFVLLLYLLLCNRLYCLHLCFIPLLFLIPNQSL